MKRRWAVWTRQRAALGEEGYGRQMGQATSQLLELRLDLGTRVLWSDNVVFRWW